MSAPQSQPIPAVGKTFELTELDGFIWATLRGWGALPIASPAVRFSLLLPSKSGEVRPEDAAKELRAEEEHLKLVNFTKLQEEQDYPYLFSLVTVRLWALTEAAVREFVEAVIKLPGGPPDRRKFEKLRGQFSLLLGADLDSQAETIADALWHQADDRPEGTHQFEVILAGLGVSGSLHNTIEEIQRELAESRHCIVHKSGKIDGKFLKACPWVALQKGKPVPTTIARYWFHRTATYCYLLELGHRWAKLRDMTQIAGAFKSMSDNVLEELSEAWKRDKALPAKKTA